MHDVIDITDIADLRTIEPADSHFGTPVVLIGSSNEDGSPISRLCPRPSGSAGVACWARQQLQDHGQHVRTGECVLNLHRWILSRRSIGSHA